MSAFLNECPVKTSSDKLSIPYNPVFFSYAVVTPSAATLYVDSNKFRPEVISHLGDSVHVRPYEAIFEDVEMMSKSLGAEVTMNIDAHGYANGHANGFVNGYTDGYSNGDPNGATNGDIDGTPKGTHDGNHRQQVRVKKFMVSNKASWALHQFLGGVDKVEEIRSPVGDAKAIKNETELEGMRQCHLRDGAALSEYFAWLEEELVFKGTKLDEVEGADMLAQIRSYVAKRDEATIFVIDIILGKINTSPAYLSIRSLRRELTPRSSTINPSEGFVQQSTPKRFIFAIQAPNTWMARPIRLGLFTLVSRLKWNARPILWS